MTEQSGARTGEAAGRRSLGVALLVHVAIISAVRALPPSKAVDAVPVSASSAAAEIDVAVEAPAPPSPAAVAPPSTAAETTRLAAVARPSATSATPPGAGATEGRGASAAVGGRAEGEPGTGAPSGDAPAAPLVLTVPHAPTPEELGIGANPFLPRSEAQVEAAETKRRAEAALRDPLAEQDRKLGLGPEGPVLTALAESTAQSLAPVRGRAVFIATANARGEIVSLELADAEGTGGRPSWADAGRIAEGALKTKKVRIPPGKTKAVMRVEVVSAWKMPSGQDPGNNITLMHIPLSKGEGKDSPTTEFLTPKIQVIPIEIAPGVKIPIVSLQLNLLSTNIDPTNVGAKPQRVIHTRLLDSTVM